MTEFSGDRFYYRWRSMNGSQRNATLDYRRENRRPWHSPPHFDSESGIYLVSATCYEHRPVIGYSSQRMEVFASSLLETCAGAEFRVSAWVVLPNHYHMLVHAAGAKRLIAELGRLHGRTSFQWNGEENRRGRKVWFNAVDTAIESEERYWAALVYVLNNPVKHGYVKLWQEWPYSSAAEWLDAMGREAALGIWSTAIRSPAYKLFD